MARRGHVLDVEVGTLARQLFGSLTDYSLTRRLETRMAMEMRDALRATLLDAINDALREGKMPFRTGRGYRQLLSGCRAFGTKFQDLRGYIIGPDYMVAHERGTLIEPVHAPQLAIPLPAALRPDGTPKLPNPRSWKLHGSFIYKSKKNGRGYIARRNASGALELLYVFVDEAQLSKHKGYMANAWRGDLNKLLERFGAIFLSAIQSIDVDTFVAAGTRAGHKIGK